MDKEKILKAIEGMETTLEPTFSAITNELSSKDRLDIFLKLVSQKIWDRIGFSRNRFGLKVYETTITQNLIFILMEILDMGILDIQLFESLDEKANGNDIECFVKYGSKFLFFPIQAKILYKNERYEKFNHKVGKELQLDLLRSYANEKKGIPLFLLYNYSSNFEKLKQLQEQIDFEYQLYGCSLVSADLIDRSFTYVKSGVKNTQKPSFFSLHPKYAIPFFELIKFNLSKFKKMNPLIKNLNQYKKYTYKELLDDENWKNLVPPAGIGRTPHYDGNLKEILKNQKPSTENKFNPKFRLILGESKKQIDTKLIYVH